MEGVQEILSRAGIFQGVDPVAVNNLIEQMETVRFPRGTTIFEEGEPGDRLYIITAGKIKLARHAADGRENLLTIMVHQTCSVSCPSSTQAHVPPPQCA